LDVPALITSVYVIVGVHVSSYWQQGIVVAKF
jgi:hypothetical protein